MTLFLANLHSARQSHFNRKNRCVDLFGGFWVITEKLQREGRVGWDWRLKQEKGRSVWSRGGKREKEEGEGGVSYLPHLVILMQKENCYTWNSACVSGRRQSGTARFTKQELLQLQKVQGFLLPKPGLAERKGMVPCMFPQAWKGEVQRRL